MAAVAAGPAWGAGGQRDHWGAEPLEDLHGTLGEAFVPLVLLHVGGAMLSSRAHGKPLVAAMITRRKRATAPGELPP